MASGTGDLDSGIRRFLDEAAAFDRGRPVPRSNPERRAHYRARCRHFDPGRPAGIEARDDQVRGPAGPIRVRLYRPTGAAPPAPAVVYFHGGGWVLGDLDSHDGITAAIAAATGAVVLAVDYRLAPEHPFPAAFDDACAALRAAAADGGARFGVDGARLAVAGDSAGGNLAAAVALFARDRGEPRLRGQALVYPALDPDLTLPSCERNARAPVLTREDMAGYWRDYLGGTSATDDPYAAPSRARDLAGAAPAYVSTAAHDPLCDEGRLYAERLGRAGVAVEHREAPGLPHGHLRARGLSAEAAAEFAALCAALRRMLA